MSKPQRAKLPGIGTRVHIAREAAGMTLRQLGALVNVDATTLWRIEKSRQDPGAALVMAIARATCHPAGWLLTGERDSSDGDTRTPPAGWAEFCRDHYDAEPDELDIMLTIVTALPPNLRAKRVFWDAVLALLRMSLRPEQLRETIDLNAALSRSED